MKLRFHAALTFLTALAVTQVAFAGGGMHPEVAEHGMVASVHELASRAGVEIMQAFSLQPSRQIGEIKKLLEAAIANGEIEGHLPNEAYVELVRNNKARFGL